MEGLDPVRGSLFDSDDFSDCMALHSLDNFHFNFLARKRPLYKYREAPVIADALAVDADSFDCD